MRDLRSSSDWSGFALLTSLDEQFGDTFAAGCLSCDGGIELVPIESRFLLTFACRFSVARRGNVCGCTHDVSPQ